MCSSRSALCCPALAPPRVFAFAVIFRLFQFHITHTQEFLTFSSLGRYLFESMSHLSYFLGLFPRHGDTLVSSHG